MANYPVFPQKVCNVTQSWDGAYNHNLNSSGSPADYPVDIAGADGSRQAFYAPCRMKCVKIYGQVTGVKSVANGAWFTSTEPCDFPDGTKDFLTIKFVHMENSDFGSNGIYVGRVYEKYEQIGFEGATGNATGNHLHVTAGKGQMKDTGWVKNSRGQWVLQATNGQFKLDSLLWIDRDFTQMRSEKNMTFKDMPKDIQITEDVVQAVIAGRYGNGEDRKKRLSAAGYDYNEVQRQVNERLVVKTASAKSIDEISREVIRGDWGNGADRKNRLTAAGYDYSVVQKRVNEMHGGELLISILLESSLAVNLFLQ